MVQLWDLQGNRLAELKGHEGAVWEVAFGSQGILATRGADGVARLWNLDGNLLAQLKGHQGAIWSMAFDPTQPQLATSGDDGTVRIWDFQGNQLEQLTGHQGPVTTVTYSANGLLATRSEDGTARIWDVPNKLSTEIKGQTGQVWDVSFNSGDNQLALLGQDGKISLWKITEVTFEDFDYSTQKTSIQYELNSDFLYEFKGHQGKVWKVLFDPNGTELRSAGEDGTVRVWDLKNNQTELMGKQSASQEWSSPDGTKLVMQDEAGIISVWNLQGNLLTKVDIPVDSSLNWRFSPDSNYLIISAGSSYENNLITYLLNIQTKQLTQLKGALYEDWNSLKDDKHKGFSPDGTWFVTVDKANVYLWDLQGSQIAQLMKNPEFGTAIAFAPNSKKLATISENNSVIIWNLKGEQIEEFRNNQTNSERNISDVVFSPDGNYLATSDQDNLVQVWDIEGNLKVSLNTHHDGEGTMNVIFSPDSQQLITASFSSGAMGDRLARLWDLQGNQLAQLIERKEDDFNQVDQLEFSPNKKLLVASSDNGFVYLWDFQGHLLNKIPRPPVWGAEFKFSPDSKYLAIYGGDSIPKIWQLFDGQPAKLVVELKGHLGTVQDFEFSPSGNQLVTSGDDETIRFWDFQGNQLLQLKGTGGSIRFIPDGNWLLSKGDVNYRSSRLPAWEIAKEGHSCINTWHTGDIASLLSSICSSIDNYLVNHEAITPEDKKLCQGLNQN